MHEKMFCAHGLEVISYTVHTIQSDLHIQGNPYQNNKPKICMGPQETPNSQNNLKKARGFTFSNFYTITKLS